MGAREYPRLVIKTPRTSWRNGVTLSEGWWVVLHVLAAVGLAEAIGALVRWVR